MGFAALLLVGQLVFPAPTLVADQPSLEALAAASGRPRECSPLKGTKTRSRRPSVWQRARVPELATYCDLVAKAHVRLEGDPKGALELAEKADAAWPGHAGALVAQGRALLSLGKPKEALERLTSALAIDKLSLEEPRAMRAHARALVQNGKVKEGAQLYRTLVPRGSLLPDSQRARLLLEAAFASMTDAGQNAQAGVGRAADDKRIQAALGEALAFAAEARSEDETSLMGDVLLAIALIQDRAGDASKASVALSEAARLGANAASAGSYLADADDAIALKALALESTSVSEAQQAWTAYAAATKIEPFAASARARAAGLSKAGATPAKKKKKAP